MTFPPRLIPADEILAPSMWLVAVDAVGAALRSEVDPARERPRIQVGAPAGELLLMPSQTSASVGVKVVSVAPDNVARGKPRVQGVYILFDQATLSPSALLDGDALTILRTPAVSAFAVSQVVARGVARVAILGTGPQAWGHAHALGTVTAPEETVVIGRDPDRSRALVSRLRREGIEARLGDRADLRRSDVIACATGSQSALIDADDVGANACVVAVGSHSASHRELGARLMGGSTVIVEDGATALREAGDVAMAISEGRLEATDLVELTTLARATGASPTGRVVFKSVGMAWQDLVVAEAVVGYKVASDPV